MKPFWMIFCLGVSLLTGCGTVKYVTPGGPAALESINDFEVRDGFETVAAAEFPARFAVVRVQAPHYRSEGNRGIGEGKFSVVTHLDVETKEHFDRLQSLPMVAGIARLNALLVPQRLQSIRDLRRAVAPLHADLLLVYTLDTTFSVQNKANAAWSVLSLGIARNKTAKIQCIASAILVDVRTGHLHGLSEAIDESSYSVSAWTEERIIDDARLSVEGKAFEGLVNAFEATWNQVLQANEASKL